MHQWIDMAYCTGCSVCVTVCPCSCIQMRMNKDGFYVPVLDSEQCISCHMCEKRCPVIQPLKRRKEESVAFAAFSQSTLLRMESSSGGIFSEIANDILDKGGCIFGAAFSDDFQVMHIGVEDKNQLYKLRGAKYAQSVTTDCFKEVERRLKRHQTVLFSGTPCQVAGLKSYLYKEYSNLLTIDFVCHGVPSPEIWKQYVVYRAKTDNDGKLPQKINLRSKATGWSRYRYSTVFQYTDHKDFSCINGENLFMKLFVGDYINRKSCSHCKFKGYDRVSDITLGDFWGIWDIDPQMDDDKGTSLVLLHSQKGKKSFDLIKKHLKVKQVSLEEASAQNPSLLQSSSCHPKREQILQMGLQGDFERIKVELQMKRKFLLFRALKRD